MTDGSDSDSTGNWADDRSRTDPHPEVSSVESITDADAGTVTFAWRRPEDRETTTAWITADAGLVVDVSEMR